MTEQAIREAYIKIRAIDQTIPDDVLDFMKDAAIEKLKRDERYDEGYQQGFHDASKEAVREIRKNYIPDDFRTTAPYSPF